MGVRGSALSSPHPASHGAGQVGPHLCDSVMQLPLVLNVVVPVHRFPALEKLIAQAEDANTSVVRLVTVHHEPNLPPK